MSWCTIESDPGVFTELISSIGVKGVQVAELWDLEKETFDKLKPVYGLIFLFKWQRESGSRVESTDTEHPDVFFAQQVINNACATQAIISILLNRPDIDIGPELTQFKDFAQVLDPSSRGLAIGNSDLIRTVHNSFAHPEPFEMDEKVAASDDDEVYHFIGYVPCGGKLYELDGLKPGPVALGNCTLDNWLDTARPAIQERMQKYSEKEIRFNLLALVQNRKEVYSQRLEQIQARKTRISQKLARVRGSQDAMDTDDDLPRSESELQNLLNAAAAEEDENKMGVQEEEERFARWKVENTRRKHNYVPFVFNLLKQLAERKQLQPLIEEGKKAIEERRKREQEKGKKSTSGKQ